jgi:hypothetical protein
MFTFKVGYGFISGGPQFVRQKCSFCRVLSIVATSARDNWLGVLEHTKLSWTHIVHAEVSGVTDGRYWVGTNPTAGGGIVSKKNPNFRFPRDMLLSPTPREDVPCTILQLDTRGQLSEDDDDSKPSGPVATGGNGERSSSWRVDARALYGACSVAGRQVEIPEGSLVGYIGT